MRKTTRHWWAPPAWAFVSVVCIKIADGWTQYLYWFAFSLWMVSWAVTERLVHYQREYIQTLEKETQ